MRWIETAVSHKGRTWVASKYGDSRSRQRTIMADNASDSSHER